MMLTVHRSRHTWSRDVNAFIALTEFARQKAIANGLPQEKVYVKPNFVENDPGQRKDAGDYALFVGRLSPEKGVNVLLKAWTLLNIPLSLKIAGDGPTRNELEAQVQEGNMQNVHFLGRLDREQTQQTMKGASFLIVPSLWYEGFPMVLAESFACGVPILGSRLGAMQEVIDDGCNGLHFTAGSSADLAEKIVWAYEHSTRMVEMGRNARWKFETHYGPEANYASLRQIYTKAIDECAR
jgi:glycosyltransferase involved in cell wall biosynthesis